jgi:hypothetical protein
MLLCEDVRVSDRDNNWKKHLLRTSVPLEHEVARILSNQEFSVSADYSYHRIDNGVDKEFSVDVRGVKGSGSPTTRGRECLLDVLVECKYCVRDTTWLFLPQPKYAISRLRDGLAAVDLFSPKFVHDLRADDDPTVTECYSAVEVGMSGGTDENSKGKALDSKLRRGARQLQYALPSLIMLRARVAALLPIEDTLPFFFSSLLVTNASLVIADATFGVAAVETAKSLSELGEEVPYLIWSADLGPDFYHHCQRQFAGLTQFAKTEPMRAIEAKRKAAREASWVLPSALARRIALDPTDAIHIANFKNVIVVNILHLDKVLTFLGYAFHRLANALKDEPLVKW